MYCINVAHSLGMRVKTKLKYLQIHPSIFLPKFEPTGANLHLFVFMGFSLIKDKGSEPQYTDNVLLTMMLYDHV